MIVFKGLRSLIFLRYALSGIILCGLLYDQNTYAAEITIRLEFQVFQKYYYYWNN